MQGVVAFKNAAVLEELLFAVLAVGQEAEAVMKHIQKSFGVSDSDIADAKENIARYYEEPSISLELKSIKIQNLLNLAGGTGKGISCLVRVDGTEILTKELNDASPEWDVNHELVSGEVMEDELQLKIAEEFLSGYRKDRVDGVRTYGTIQDLWRSKVDVETWQEQEKETRDTLTKVWLRSLDAFSKKFRSSLRSESSPTSPSLVSAEENRSSFLSKEKETATLGKDFKNDLQREEAKQKQDSESNWVLNAFATLRRPNSSKKSISHRTKRPAPQPVPTRHLDMSSPIPTGHDLLKTNGSVKSEKSFFAKNETKDEGCSNSTIQLDQEQLGNINIKAKSEVNVRRQLFSGDLLTSSGGEDGNSDSKPKPISIFNPVYNFRSSLIDLTKRGEENSIFSRMVSPQNDTKLKESPPKPKQNLALRYGTLKLSPRNEFQLWKRMSLTLRDKSDSLNLSEIDPKSSTMSLDYKDKSLTLPKEVVEHGTTSSVSSSNEGPPATNKIKVKVGLVSTRLKDIFLKMKCPEWTAEEEKNLALSILPKEVLPTRPPIIVLSMLLRCHSQPVIIPPPKVLYSCLRHLVMVESHLEIDRNEDCGLCLPLTKKSRLILKILAFVYNIPEAQISLACWLALIQGPSSMTCTKVNPVEGETPLVDKKQRNPQEEDASSSGKEDVGTDPVQQNLKMSSGGFEKTHTTFLFNWLVKLETAASCSCYTEDEERQIAVSIQNFVDGLYNQLRRIHASFPVNQSSHLSYGLRCIWLLAESKSLQSIMAKSKLETGDSWPTSNVMNAVKIHAKNWSDALVSEIRCEQGSRRSGPASCEGGPGGHRKPPAPSPPVKPSPNLFLLQAVMNGEKATLLINDFIGLGRDIYENLFQSGLKESYLKAVWPSISVALETLLSPVESALKSSDPKSILSSEFESLQDLHISLWILLLQLSKLQRFQDARTKECSPLILPGVFSETFHLLCCLWLSICWFRAKELASLQCQTDDLTSTENEDGLSSSARELIEFFAVTQEKLSRFTFPSDAKFKEKLAEYLENGIKSVVEVYKCEICAIVLTKISPNNTLNSHMCIATNGIHRVNVMAGNTASCLFSRREKVPDSAIQIGAHTKDACFFFFTKSLPRISVWITNALSSREREEASSDRLVEWIKSALDPVSDHSSKSPVFFRHFWDFLFEVVKEKLERYSVPKDYRILGNFLEKVYFFYKISLRLELHPKSQIEFQSFMDEVQLKGSPTTDVIQMYYAERCKEQEALVTKRQPLVLNAYFCKDRGLRVEVYLSPYVNAAPERPLICSNDEKRPIDRSPHDRLPSLSFFKDPQLTLRVKQRASEVFDWLTKSSGISFYVKVQPVPTNWFSKAKEKKTKSTQQNPPVFDDQLFFNVKCTDEGVMKGGFLLFRLKYSSVRNSRVDSEGFLPLRDISLLPFEDHRQNKHTFLKLSAPTRIEDYRSLRELANRKQDKEAIAFLSHLHQSFWAAQWP